MEIGDLTDIWRQRNPESRQFVWGRKNPITIMYCLDFFLISNPLIHLVDQAGIKPGINTDHSMITLEISANLSKKGSGFWRLNVSLLDNMSI